MKQLRKTQMWIGDDYMEYGITANCKINTSPSYYSLEYSSLFRNVWWVGVMSFYTENRIILDFLYSEHLSSNASLIQDPNIYVGQTGPIFCEGSLTKDKKHKSRSQ